ncbi:MAG TPA: hypothetical protein EYM28_09785 [Rhodospirillales bacterium]|nr:hypothetical protein [Rhodospirillales bacterium]
MGLNTGNLFFQHSCIVVSEVYVTINTEFFNISPRTGNAVSESDMFAFWVEVTSKSPHLLIPTNKPLTIEPIPFYDVIIGFMPLSLPA